MTLTINLPPDIEQSLNAVVAEKGVDAEAFVIEMLREQLQPGLAVLRQQIADWITPDVWDRHRTLIARRRAGRWREADRAEFLALNNEVEMRHAERLERVAQYARLRGLTLDEALKELGIEFPIPD